MRKKETERLPLVSNVHRSLAAELTTLGYDVDLYVGASEYRVDIRIMDPTNKGQYITGILLDGPMYQNAESARDRDVLREQVLQQLGWNLIYVWSPDWWEDRDGVIRSIVEAIQRGKEEKEIQTPSKVESANMKESLNSAEQSQASSISVENGQSYPPSEPKERKIYEVVFSIL